MRSPRSAGFRPRKYWRSSGCRDQRQGGLLGRRGEAAACSQRRRATGAARPQANAAPADAPRKSGRRQGARRQAARRQRRPPARAPTALVRPRRGAGARADRVSAAPPPRRRPLAARRRRRRPTAPVPALPPTARPGAPTGGAADASGRRRAQAPDPRLAAGRARARHRRRPPARRDRLPGFPPRPRRRSAAGSPTSRPAASAAAGAAAASTTKRPSRVRRRTAVAEPDVIRINSGSTVKDVAEYLDVPVPGDHQEADGAGRDEDAHPDAVRRDDRGARGRAR